MRYSRRAFLTNAVAAIMAGAVLPVMAEDTPQTVGPQAIDSHVHVWVKDPRFPFAEGANVPEGIDASVETLLRRMEANQVARTVLIQVIHYKWDNRYLVDCLRRFPGKFAGVCRVNPEARDASDQLIYWTSQGCDGVRLSPAADDSGDWIRKPQMYALWGQCQRLHVPMTLLLPASRLPDVRPLIDHHQDLTVVIDHMADCPIGDTASLAKLLDLARYPRVFVKITHLWSLSRQSYPFRDSYEMVARVRDAFGSQRIMGGTDWPIKTELASYEQRLALYREEIPFFNADERKDVLYRTVQRVWPSSR
ncbi:amidohydrolase family protein [Terriglobus albidus]|uniref:amidohydrolase family protein n=1 Tax=Terriglobus albidus TaxID=1592106 RepID=UPI0021DFBF7D|nr:amidohydrolase family protein [Terriglobus albidus]